MIKNMEMGNINIWMRLNIMDNGKTILGKVMEHIIIQMEIDMKVIGIMIFRMGLGLIIILMGIFTRVNGRKGSKMDKETIFTMATKEFIKEIGRKAKKKGLGN